MFVATASAAGTLATPQLASAAARKDRVVGNGLVAAFNDSVRVSAQSGPNGERPHETIVVDFSEPSGFVDRATVSCMIVTGNTAVIGGPTSSGEHAFVVVQDGKTGDMIRTLHGGFPGAPAPDQQACAAALQDLPPLSPVDGDFKVEHAV